MVSFLYGSNLSCEVRSAGVAVNNVASDLEVARGPYKSSSAAAAAEGCHKNSPVNAGAGVPTIS